MAVHGYVTHAARNRRFTALFVLGYVFAFELIGAFALTMLLLIVDHEHTILSDPAGYTLRYALPIAALSALVFRHLYRGHAAAVTASLGVDLVSRAEEPRFVAIAEAACTTLGVRLPRFGVIEVSEPNAVTIGEGPVRGLIAVTRGLLDRLDDDELAAVLAHEASHVRQGDTRLLAANHALMRTAVLLQVHNPLRLEDWRQLIIPLLLPPTLVVFLAGSAATMLSMQLARAARRALKLGRDHVADGEAVRVTHFPEALLSALDKIGGRGAFPGSHRVEGLLFDGPADHEGGTHPAIADRRRAIATLGRVLVDPARRRRDTRGDATRPARPPRPVRAPLFPCDATGRPLAQPPTATLRLVALRVTDPDAYRQWQQASIAWYEWRVTDRRNALGLAPAMIVPVAAVATFLLVFWWPADGDLSRLAHRFGPAALVEIAAEVNSGPTCEGPSYPDGLCPDYAYSPAQLATKRGLAAPPPAAASSPPAGPGGFVGWVPLLLPALIVLAVLRPQRLRRLFGVVEDDGRMQRRDPAPAIAAPDQPVARNRTFGRKVS